MTKISLKNIKFLILGISLSLFVSCNLFPCGWATDLDSVDEKPKADFLIGTYKLDERTLDFIPGYENAESARLILKKDGSLEIKNTPIGTFDFMSYYDETDQNVNGTGTWKTEKGKYNAELNVGVKFEKKYSELDFWTDWDIYKKNGKPVIFIIIGDPDSCAAARFIKIAE